MMAFINMVLAGFAVGLIDWLNKGLPIYRGREWKDLSKFKRGWKWPVMFFIIWLAVLYAFVVGLDNKWYWLGVPLFINADASYYIYKRIVYAGFVEQSYWNKWMGIWKSAKSYWWTVIIVNVVMAAIIMSIGTL